MNHVRFFNTMLRVCPKNKRERDKNAFCMNLEALLSYSVYPQVSVTSVLQTYLWFMTLSVGFIIHSCYYYYM